MSSIQYPQGADYQLAMQHADFALIDPVLKQGQVEMRPDRATIPVVRSGGFVFTYHLHLAHGPDKALRCYNKAIPDLFARYDHIVPMTRRAADLFLPTDFQRVGILVNGQRYPLMVMEWVTGETLNNWIAHHLTAAAIGSLIPQFDHLLSQLAQLGIAHGDLQHGNILVDEQGHLRLIDYDSMYVPALAGLPPADAGQRNYQHPQRRGEFDARLDRFPGIVIGLALRALQADPTLWPEFGISGENMLFTREDFLAPTRSPLFTRLRGVAAVAPYLANFQAYCQGRYEDVPRPSDFFAATTPVQVSQASQAAPRWQTVTPVIAADDIAGLLRHAGEYVEVIGQVRAVYQRPANRPGPPFAQLVFTDRRGFVALIFARTLAQFVASGRDPQQLFVGRWVTMTLVLSLLPSEASSPVAPRPQMVIDAPAQIGILTEAQARARLTQGLSRPLGFTAPLPAAPPASAGGPPSSPGPTAAKKTPTYAEQVQQHWGARARTTRPVVPTSAVSPRPTARPHPASPPTPTAPRLEPLTPTSGKTLGQMLLRLVQQLLR